MPAALFDMDRTLVRRETASLYVRYQRELGEATTRDLLRTLGWVFQYTVGTLVVDIFDAKNKQLIFRGTATDELSDQQDKNAKKLAKASDKIFKDFPPGSAKK